VSGHRQKRHLTVFLPVLLFLSLPFVPGALRAQSPPPSPPPSASAPPSDATTDDSTPPPFKEEIVVTANLLPTPAEEVGSSVTVIGREEIERRGETAVLDLLRTVPGLEVNQSGGPGSFASVFLRGANSNQTLVLVDGVRVTNTSGGYDFSALRADDVERIEILRGPQSTLYGSEAIGGVVSIVTRRGRTGFHLAVDGRGGSRSTHELNVAADGGTGALDYSLSVADRRTAGVSAASERRGNRETDPFSDRTLAGRLGFTLLGDGRVDLVLRHADADSSLDGFTFGIGPTDDPNYTQHRQLTVGSLQLVKPITAWWDLKLSTGIHRDDTRGRDPDTFFNNYDLKSEEREVSAQSDFKLAANDTLIAGFSGERRQGETAGSYDESLSVSSFYLEDDWAWRDRLFLTAGARHDRYSRFGEKTTYRLTGSYLLPAAVKLHGSFGTGFRGPSFDELFFPFAGNPNLRPETSTGVELGVDRTFGNGVLTAGVTWFSSRFKDLIDFNLDTFTFENERRASSEGVETTLDVRPTRSVELRGSYTYNDTEDQATGRQLARRPRHRWTLLAAYTPSGTGGGLDRLRGTVSLVGVSGRIDSDGTRMDSYTRVDLSLDDRVTPWLQPYLLVQNLFNQKYEEVTGYTTPGFTLLAGLRLTYN
jgi:vitamin B12 transporter